MKNKLFLSLLTTSIICLAGCGQPNNAYGKTIIYQSVFADVDSAYNSQYSNKTTRQLVAENMNNINWDTIGMSVPHTTADEAIEFVLNYNKQQCDSKYSNYKIVMGSKEEKTAKITGSDGQEVSYSVTDVGEVIYDFKDTNENTWYTYQIISITNGKIKKGYLQETSFLGMVYDCGHTVGFPLKTPVQLGEGLLSIIKIASYANFKN